MAIRKEWTIGGIAAVLGLVATMVTLWPTFGWVTPTTHAADIEAVEADNLISSEAVLEAIKGIGLKMDTNHRQWLCDEKEEELIDLLFEQEQNDSVEIRRDIAKAEKWLDDNDCSDFDEVG